MHETALSQRRLRFLRDQMLDVLHEIDTDPDGDPAERTILIASIANLNERITA